MKFESEYGLGEICWYLHESAPNRRVSDVLQVHRSIVKVVRVCFEVDGAVRYTVEHSSSPSFVVQRFIVCAGSLDGDPDYDQDAGAYPDDGLVPS